MDKTLILVNSVDSHSKHKQILLDKIKTNRKFFETSDNIQGKNTKENYLDYFKSNVIKDTMDKIGKDLKLPYFEWTIPEVGHQVSQEAYFKIHEIQGPIDEEQRKLGIEPRYEVKCEWDRYYTRKRYLAFTNCYYLDSPDENFKVGVQGKNGETIEVDVKEGDLLSIPHWMIRLSPLEGINIGFNSSYIFTGMELVEH